LKDLDPFKSKAILHASIAGFIFSFQGLFQEISETIPCSIRFRKELQKPFHQKLFGKKFAKGLSKYYAKNWPELYPISGSGFSWEQQLR
jgi:hypothetical protein